MKLVKTEVSEQVAVITLCDEARKNALSDELIPQLLEALSHCEEDPEVRVILLTGKGQCFSAGGDIKAMNKRTGMFEGEGHTLRKNYHQGIQEIPRLIEEMETPLVALVNGAAVGAGCDLACMCDIRLMSDNAFFSESFASLNLIPGDGGTFFLSRAVGYAFAMEMMLTAKRVKAPEAIRVGLVSDAVPVDELLTKGRELAKRICAQAPEALALGKRALKRAKNDDLHSHLERLSAYQGLLQTMKDHQVGLDSLSSKKKAHFFRQ